MGLADRARMQISAMVVAAAPRLRQGAGVFVLAGLALAALALISHNPGDPSFNVAADGQAENWLGFWGAGFADFIYQMLGHAVWFGFIPIAAAGHRAITRDPVTLPYMRRILAVISVLLAAMVLALTPVGRDAGAPFPGGALGQLQARAVQPLLDMMGIAPATPAAFFIMLFGLVLALVLALLAAGWLRRAGQLGWAGVKATARLPQNFRSLPGRMGEMGNWRARLPGGLMPRFGASASGAVEAGVEEEISASAGRQRAVSDDAAPDMPSSVKVDDKKTPPRRGRRVTREAQTSLNLDAATPFELPPLRLLTEHRAPRQSRELSKDALEANARLLETVLGDFGIRGKIGRVRPGPVVTLYELEPAAGVRSSRVVGLADDIARSMSAISCRVAPVSGANVIGIELPNAARELVSLRELLSSADFEGAKGKLTLALGKDIGGAPVMADLSKMPHLLVAGTTGSGKSVGINTMILSVLYRMTPEQCRLILVDPKMLELSVYDGIPHLLAPVVTEPKKAVVALKWVVQEMENRYRKMAKIGVRNIEGFNERMAEARRTGEELSRRVQTGFDPDSGEAVFEEEVIEPENLPFIIVVVDEMADLMMVAGKEIEGAVQRLAQMARAAGVHLITATQRPSVDVITGTIKANFPSRISFQVTSKIDSRTVLGEQGAEQLLGQGDMLYMGGGGRIERVHGPFVSDGEVEKVVRFLKRQATPDYIEQVTAEQEEEAGPGAAASGDTLYDQAVAIVTRDGRASTSYVQRRLQIGYNRAARLIEQMEEEGVISAPNHAGKREVLAGKQ
ncbi:MAG: DNA translocase FtsK 4TM domain-containing protein [Parvibaculales bacterium]